jgi:hypothetical protein
MILIPHRNHLTRTTHLTAATTNAQTNNLTPIHPIHPTHPAHQAPPIKATLPLNTIAISPIRTASPSILTYQPNTTTTPMQKSNTS